MLQEPRVEEKSRVILTRLARFTENMTRIDGQIGLLRTARGTRIDTQVDGQAGLLRIAR
jgi:hypothetical protein